MRARWLAGLALVALAGAGACRGDKPAASGTAGVRSDAAAAPGSRFEVLGLAASGAGPVLSWRPVEKAGEYLVTVRPAAGHGKWMWMGTGTQVIYGVAEEPGDFLLPIRGRTPIQLLTAEPGARYAWSVVAFGADQEVLAVSGPAEFTYNPPPGAAELPPRAPPTFLPPVFDCGRLVPTAMRDRFFKGWAPKEWSPCGEEPHVGCPWTCEFDSGSGESRQHVRFYYTCRAGAANLWETYPKLPGGQPIAGVGRAAAIGHQNIDIELRFLDGDAPCVVSVSANLPEARVVELAKAADAELTADAVGLAP